MLTILATKTVEICAFVYLKNERNVANKSHSTSYLLIDYPQLRIAILQLRDRSRGQTWNRGTGTNGAPTGDGHAPLIYIVSRFNLGGLEALFGGLRPPKPPRGDGTEPGQRPAIIRNFDYDATKLRQAYNCIIITSNWSLNYFLVCLASVFRSKDNIGRICFYPTAYVIFPSGSVTLVSSNVW